jgi:hypothetical protein
MRSPHPRAASATCTSRRKTGATATNSLREIDLRTMADAREWAASAMERRPSREEFFQCFVPLSCGNCDWLRSRRTAPASPHSGHVCNKCCGFVADVTGPFDGI